MFLALLQDLSLTEYGIIGAVLFIVFGMLQKQMQFSNKLAADHAKRREEDLDKISAALIIIQENAKAQTEMCKEVVANTKEVSEQQKLLAKDMAFVRDLTMKQVPNKESN
jgi:hypothetical protein